MCFSATASFTASAVIGVIGVKTFRSCKTKQEHWFGAIPFLFALQQFSEGLVWLSFSHPNYHYLQEIFTWLFLFFAWIVWPIMLPISVIQLEQIEWRKKLLRLLMITGLFSALIGLYQMYIGRPFPVINSFHIRYELNNDTFSNLGGILQQSVYVISTLIPLFLSSHRKIRYFALINLVILALAFLFYRNTIPSTWCFFAAILSGVIYWVLQPDQQKVSATA